MVRVPKWQETAYRRRLVRSGRGVAGRRQPRVSQADARRVGKGAREAAIIEEALRSGLVPMVPVPLDDERAVRLKLGPLRRRVLALRWAWRQRRSRRLFREAFGEDAVVRRARGGAGLSGAARVVRGRVIGRRR